MKLAEIDGEKNRTRYRSLLERYAYAAPEGKQALGDRPVGEISLVDVAEVLRPIWTTKTETATKLRERLEAAFDFAIAHGWRDKGSNPAIWRGGLQPMLPAPSRVAKGGRQPALAIDDVPLWFAALRLREG